MTRTEILAKYPDLRRANLYGADLSRANLYGADLRSADLYGADLNGADLRRANLYGADLSRANLRRADLHGADLNGANLYGADLNGADLSGADLRSANLYGANLYGADLYGADLNGANLHGATGLLTLATPPEEGAFVAYKKVGATVITLRIPASAARTGAYVGRKCRAAFVETLSGAEVPIRTERGALYANGARTDPDSYDPDPRVECTHGIHFFMTRKEAEDY